VDWRLCINGDAECDFEVNGTPVRLVYNPSVYRLIVSRLRRA
jgi:hypothetical protein